MEKSKILKFMELVRIDTPRKDSLERTAKIAPGVDASVPMDLTAKDVRRVMAFVVDDVTIPAEDMPRVRKLLSDFQVLTRDQIRELKLTLAVSVNSSYGVPKCQQGYFLVRADKIPTGQQNSAANASECCPIRLNRPANLWPGPLSLSNRSQHTPDSN
jgi:hypothetical protein